ncbi:MAG: DinB family protein [Ignavibacteriae bacterium]|nr:DinB family protein [Ignavibacteriota bacterium]
MYRTIADFLKDWKYEHESTVKLFRSLSDSSLSQKVTPDGRSLGFLAWHITVTLGEMGGKSGLSVQSPAEDAPLPSSVSEIAETYAIAGDTLAEAVQKTWNETMLLEEIEMYGEKWTRGYTLLVLLKHQIHHRAQMTVLMRQAGLNVPGIYGPSKEEWSQYGMNAPQ